MTNTIEFRPITVRYNEGQWVEQCAAIYIDGTNFKDIITNWEKANSIDNHHKEVALYLLNKALAEHVDLSLDESGSLLYSCVCGEWGCWPFYACDKEEGDTIVWDKFKQWHRPEWDYSNFGPFVFDKKQYCEQLRKLQELIKESVIIGNFCHELTDPMISGKNEKGEYEIIKHIFPDWAEKVRRDVRKQLNISEDRYLLFETVVSKGLTVDGKAVQGSNSHYFVLIEEQDSEYNYPPLGVMLIDIIDNDVVLKQLINPTLCRFEIE